MRCSVLLLVLLSAVLVAACGGGEDSSEAGSSTTRDVGALDHVDGSIKLVNDEITLTPDDGEPITFVPGRHSSSARFVRSRRPGSRPA